MMQSFVLGLRIETSAYYYTVMQLSLNYEVFRYMTSPE